MSLCGITANYNKGISNTINISFPFQMFIYIQTMELYIILSMSWPEICKFKSFSLRLCTPPISLVENSMVLVFFFCIARKIWPGRPPNKLMTLFQFDHALLQIFYNAMLVNSRVFRLGILVIRDGVFKASTLMTLRSNDGLALDNYPGREAWV